MVTRDVLHKMKYVIYTISLYTLFQFKVYGDSYNIQTYTFSSPKGETLIRWVPKEESNNLSNSKIFVYKVNNETQEYKVQKEFDFESFIGDVYVNDPGTHFVRLLSSFGERSIDLHNINGKSLKLLNLHDFYTREERYKLGKHKTTLYNFEHVFWRNNDTELVISPPYTHESAEQNLEKLVINVKSLQTFREKVNYTGLQKKIEPALFRNIFITILFALGVIIFIATTKSRASRPTE